VICVLSSFRLTSAHQHSYPTNQLFTFNSTRRKYTNACKTPHLHNHKMLHLWILSWAPAGRLKM